MTNGLRHGEQADLDAVIGFEALLRGLDDAIAWVRRLGVPVPDGGRYPRYRALVAELAANYARPEWQLDAAGVQRAFNALFEASDLQTIHAGFAGGNLPGLVERLRTLVQGPEQVSQEELEDGGIHARNFAFELVVAGRLLQAGHPPRLDERGDAIVTLGDHRVVVECKRPRRANSVRHCLVRARDQALGDINGRGVDRTSGLLAVEASVVVNPGNGLLAAARPLPEALNELSDRMAQAISQNMEGLWHPRILGAMARFSGLVVADGIPVYAQQWAFIRHNGTDAARLELSARLSESLRQPGALRGAIPQVP